MTAESNAGPFIPIDKWRLVKIVFFLHGISALLPWNMLINADSYFVEYKLNPNVATNCTGPNQTLASCPDPEDELEWHRLNFLPFLSTASKAPNIIFQLVNLLFSSTYRAMSFRLIVTFVVQIVMFLVMIAMAFANTQSWAVGFFWTTMVIAVIFNIANGLFQSCVYGVAAKFPMPYINMATLGFSFSGTLASIFYIISLLLSPHPKVVAIYYFTLATIFMIVCLGNEVVVGKNTFFRYYVLLDEKSSNDTQTGSYSMSSYDNQVAISEGDLQTEPKRAQVPEVITNNNEPEEIYTGVDQYLFILRKSWVQLLNVILIYVATFCTFPAIQAGIKPLDGWLSQKFFAPVVCFLFYNVFSTLGNFVAERVMLPKPRGVLFWVLLRFVMVPFFMLCNYLPEKRAWPVLISNDLIYALGVIVMSFSNGYFNSLTMMYAPNCVPPLYASNAAMMASASIIIGILIGVQCTMGLQYLILNVHF